MPQDQLLKQAPAVTMPGQEAMQLQEASLAAQVTEDAQVLRDSYHLQNAGDVNIHTTKIVQFGDCAMHAWGTGTESMPQMGITCIVKMLRLFASS